MAPAGCIRRRTWQPVELSLVDERGNIKVAFFNSQLVLPPPRKMR
jgi:hypothetical protein